MVLVNPDRDFKSLAEDKASAESIRVREQPRKTSRVKDVVTVLKPTQVDEARSLRCTREPSLRNSAK
jgi:hypothetical protein